MDHTKGSSLKAGQKVLNVMVVQAWEIDNLGCLLVEGVEKKGLNSVGGEGREQVSLRAEQCGGAFSTESLG